MLNERINKKREELNNSIINQQDYKTTYKLSVELDDLIAEYYKKRSSKHMSMESRNNKLKIEVLI